MRLFLLIGFSLLVSTCAPVEGRTPCGLTVIAPSRVGIDNVSRVERVTLETLDAETSEAIFDYARACRAISPYLVTVRPSFNWYDPENATLVAGLCHCDTHEIEVGVAADISAFPLPHELAHAIENCVDPMHSTWAARGIFQALDDVSKILKENP